MQYTLVTNHLLGAASSALALLLLVCAAPAVWEPSAECRFLKAKAHTIATDPINKGIRSTVGFDQQRDPIKKGKRHGPSNL
jgi:hypothetical protein